MSGPISRSAPRVLVVEGRAELREALKDALGRTFYVVTARSSEGALAGLEDYRPRAILVCERQSGEIDGLELCRKIRSSDLGSEFLLIVYGGKSPDPAGIKEQIGIDEYVGKGVTLKQINELLCKHLRLGWAPMAKSAEPAGDERWSNPLTSGGMISARKGGEEEEEEEEEPKKRFSFSRLFRR
ncbi:MAG: response regulator [Myxococcota bacterium]|nr:response regulator [Myxococcota bacterium]